MDRTGLVQTENAGYFSAQPWIESELPVSQLGCLRRYLLRNTGNSYDSIKLVIYHILHCQYTVLSGQINSSFAFPVVRHHMPVIKKVKGHPLASSPN